ncbi:hypothetical protein CEXT_350621 [Caerostris extrusa]|uniref:Uncharacterized protein n=1 Tax=Caerostris extrusa TaxID=172846 RepID=A0AAV4X6Z1_CAEEX|nr:hypothetical protein CEXT_350621 [Caerostris extrusa]
MVNTIKEHGVNSDGEIEYAPFQKEGTEQKKKGKEGNISPEQHERKKPQGKWRHDISRAAYYGKKEAQTQNMSKYHPRTWREFRLRNRIRSFSREREQNKKGEKKEGKECAIVGCIVEKRIGIGASK